MAKVEFLADECIYQITVEFLRKEGWKVKTIEELGMIGAKDSQVFSRAQELGLSFITRDKGFGDIRKFPPSSHHGIVVLRMTPRTMLAVHGTLKRMLLEEKDLGEALFIVDHNKWRKRKKL